MGNSIAELEAELKQIHEQIRELSSKFVLEEQTDSKPGKLNMSIVPQLMEFEEREWELFRKYANLCRPESTL